MPGQVPSFDQQAERTLQSLYRLLGELEAETTVAGLESLRGAMVRTQAVVKRLGYEGWPPDDFSALLYETAARAHGDRDAWGPGRYGELIRRCRNWAGNLIVALLFDRMRGDDVQDDDEPPFPELVELARQHADNAIGRLAALIGQRGAASYSEAKVKVHGDRNVSDGTVKSNLSALMKFAAVAAPGIKVATETRRGEKYLFASRSEA